MRSKIGKVLATVALTAATLPMLATAANASDAPGWVCITRDPTPVYAYDNFTAYLFTLSPGRGFRVHFAMGNQWGTYGAYGHGAERPDRDGYVRYQHLAC